MVDCVYEAIRELEAAAVLAKSTFSLSLEERAAAIAAMMAEDAVTGDLEHRFKKILITFGYSLSPDGQWVGNHGRTLEQMAADSRAHGLNDGHVFDRLLETQRQMHADPRIAQAMVVSEDVGSGKSFIYFYSRSADGASINAVAIEHRGTPSDLEGLVAALKDKFNGFQDGSGGIDRPLFLCKSVSPTEMLEQLKAQVYLKPTSSADVHDYRGRLDADSRAVGDLIASQREVTKLITAAFKEFLLRAPGANFEDRIDLLAHRALDLKEWILQGGTVAGYLRRLRGEEGSSSSGVHQADDHLGPNAKANGHEESLGAASSLNQAGAFGNSLQIAAASAQISSLGDADRREDDAWRKARDRDLERDASSAAFLESLFRHHLIKEAEARSRASLTFDPLLLNELRSDGARSDPFGITAEQNRRQAELLQAADETERRVRMGRAVASRRGVPSVRTERMAEQSTFAMLADPLTVGAPPTESVARAPIGIGSFDQSGASSFGSPRTHRLSEHFHEELRDDSSRREPLLSRRSIEASPFTDSMLRAEAPNGLHVGPPEAAANLEWRDSMEAASQREVEREGVESTLSVRASAIRSRANLETQHLEHSAHLTAEQALSSPSEMVRNEPIARSLDLSDLPPAARYALDPRIGGVSIAAGASTRSETPGAEPLVREPIAERHPEEFSTLTSRMSAVAHSENISLSRSDVAANEPISSLRSFEVEHPPVSTEMRVRESRVVDPAMPLSEPLSASDAKSIARLEGENFATRETNGDREREVIRRSIEERLIFESADRMSTSAEVSVLQESSITDSASRPALESSAEIESIREESATRHPVTDAENRIKASPRTDRERLAASMENKEPVEIRSDTLFERPFLRASENIGARDTMQSIRITEDIVPTYERDEREASRFATPPTNRLRRAPRTDRERMAVSVGEEHPVETRIGVPERAQIERTSTRVRESVVSSNRSHQIRVTEALVTASERRERVMEHPGSSEQAAAEIPDRVFPRDRVPSVRADSRESILKSSIAEKLDENHHWQSDDIPAASRDAGLSRTDGPTMERDYRIAQSEIEKRSYDREDPIRRIHRGGPHALASEVIQEPDSREKKSGPGLVSEVGASPEEQIDFSQGSGRERDPRISIRRRRELVTAALREEASRRGVELQRFLEELRRKRRVVVQTDLVHAFIELLELDPEARREIEALASVSAETPPGVLEAVEIFRASNGTSPQASHRNA